MWKRVSPVLALVAFLCGCGHRADQQVAVAGDSAFPVPRIEFAPRQYVCSRVEQPLVIDGHLDEIAWQRAAWTDLFVDIEGDLKPPPRYQTKAKMLWDSTYFYVAAYMEEPDVWAKLIARDAVIYHDNDFELFIDPDGDSHEYYELEINALGTEWDLLLLKPYRDGAPAVNAWDIRGLRTAVYVDGTINNPRDTDRGWSVEMAVPWSVLAECAHRPTPPEDGDQWRVNFSRVQWHMDTVAGECVKRKDTLTGKTLPEDNWVWSPQGLIAMHYPEMWGYVQFSDSVVGSAAIEFSPPVDAQARWALRRLYYAERDFHQRRGRFTASLSKLNMTKVETPGFVWPPAISVSPDGFEAGLLSVGGITELLIRQDGRLWQRSHAPETEQP
ncbi:MAG: carbohydrate-binding family 9-like protein [bacterium]